MSGLGGSGFQQAVCSNSDPERRSSQDAPASPAATSAASPATIKLETTPPAADSPTEVSFKSQDFEEALKLRRANDAADRRKERNRTSVQKKRFASARKRRMVSTGILHDSPEPKRQSTDVLPLLVLVPGAPSTLLPRVPQPWEASSSCAAAATVVPVPTTLAPPPPPVVTMTKPMARSAPRRRPRSNGASPVEHVAGKVTQAAAGKPTKRRKLEDAFLDQVVSSSPKPGPAPTGAQSQMPQSHVIACTGQPMGPSKMPQRHVVARTASPQPGPSGQPKGPPAKMPQPFNASDDDDTKDDLSGIIGGVEPRSRRSASRKAQAHSTHLPSQANMDVDPEPNSSRYQIFGQMEEFVQDSDQEKVALFANIRAGSDDDEDGDNLPGNLAQDFHAEIPDGISQSVIARIQQVDAADDSAIRWLLSPDDLEFDWTKDASAFRGQREVFTGVAGPTFPYEDLTSPVDSFLKIWDTDIVDLIVKETNIYAGQVLQAGKFKEHSRLKKWYPVTREELLVFFAVLMVQANYPLSVEKDYFYNSFRFAEMPLFKTMMSYDRFILIKKFLHFVSAEVPASATQEQAKLHKIQPILDHLAMKFQALYMPEQVIALDESLLKWMGRLSFTQKLATKVAEVGIKSNEICESRTGYLWSFKIYAGKSDDQNHGDKALGLTAKIVHDLAQPLFGKGHTLVMDNFYNSPLLARCLKHNAMDVFGTLRINREFVPQPLKEIRKADMRIGEVQYSHCHDMTVLLWRDSNLVAMISTYHPVMAGVQSKHGVRKYKPQVVIDYNSTMGGIDRKDQLLAGFQMERVRNKVWYKKLFHRILNVSILNATVMFRSARRGTTRKDILHREFREQLVIGLLGKFQLPSPRNTVTLKARVPLRHAAHHVRPVLVGNHFVVKGEAGSKRRCVLCADAGRDRRTAYQCNVCRTPLCLEYCFMAYHT